MRELALAGKALLRGVARDVGLRVLPVVWSQLQVGKSRTPLITRADVAAGVDVCGTAADAVLVAIGAREAGAIADLPAELQECLGRRDPFELQAVALELAAEKRLIRQRRVEEVPDVLVLVVEVADARKEATEFRRESVR